MKILDSINSEKIEKNIDYYKELFLQEKIIGFNKFDAYDLNTNGKKEIFKSVNKFIQELSGCHENEVVITSGNQHFGQDRLSPEDSKEKHDDFSSYNIHSDISEVAEPHLTVCRLIGMIMDVFTCGPENGKTFFLDREKMFEDTPEHIREWMKQIHIVGRIGEKNHHLYKSLDWNGKIWPLRTMPGIITHPVTGINNFAFSSKKFTVIADDLSLESEYRDFINSYLSDNNNWITWEWKEGRCIIWDNVNLLHTYSSGWLDDQRVFTRLQGGFITPFYETGLND